MVHAGLRRLDRALRGLSSAALTTLYTGLYLLVMLGLVRPLLARLAARSLGRDGISHNVVAATLVALFVSSFVTELIGIHALFGAFLWAPSCPRAMALPPP